MVKHPLYLQLGQFFRRHWLVALVVAGFAGVLWMGAPAWAAPVTRPLNQTVPRPTPSTGGEPVATATPLPDDGDGGDGSAGGSGESGSGGANQGSTPAQVDPNAPNITFPQGQDPDAPAAAPGGSPSAPATQLTAQVTVNNLNLREGPGTDFNALGNLSSDVEVTVLARNEDGTWWYICCLAGTETTGWVSAQLLTPNFDRAAANELIPLFGSEPTPVPATEAAVEPEAQVAQAEEPLAVDFRIDPFFVWQGITATLSITVNNPNTIDATRVELSDELPEALTLLRAEADAGGTVESRATEAGNTLLIFRWESVPADTAVNASIVVHIADDLPDGAVIDNLVAARASNMTYSADVITIGMPPVVPPDFQ
jgi:uncharacterized repeat protein (TIGR01451 family)